MSKEKNEKPKSKPVARRPSAFNSNFRKYSRATAPVIPQKGSGYFVPDNVRKQYK